MLGKGLLNIAICTSRAVAVVSFQSRFVAQFFYCDHVT